MKLVLNSRSLFLIVLLVQTACNQAAPHDPKHLIGLEMDQYVADGKVAGVVTMVVKDGNTVHEHAAGFRDIESADLLEVSDMFRIASQTKVVTSVAAMILVEERWSGFSGQLESKLRWNLAILSIQKRS